MTATHTCTSCSRTVPTGLATVRTTLVAGELTPVAWCRVCRPVAPRLDVVPAQRGSRIVSALGGRMGA